VDGIVTITEEDKNIFIDNGCMTPIHVMPFGIDPDKYATGIPENRSLRIFHLGSMDWMPNTEGVQWFMEKAWPLIHQRVPDARLYLAGRNMPKSFESYTSPNVSVEGTVEDAGAFMRDKDIMIVPLLSGSGMRVKIVEGMAYGKTIVSTSTGAEGIACRDNENILIADNPEAFAACIADCAGNRQRIHDIGTRARMLAETTYSNHRIAEALSQFYMSILSH
jgi:glycosyltransferase involved in cell wall biosynthesis